jgi:four helix bundle protein
VRDYGASNPSEATMRVRDYRDLQVWQRAVDFVAEIYRISATFPREERFGLTAQLREASVSISANIAEGSGRATSRDFMNFLSQARRSLKESESLVLVAQRLGFVRAEHCVDALHLADETSRLLAGLRASIAKRNRTPSG